MTNSKSSKRALLTSCMSILLCVAMLLGTTFAWFTDSVSSAKNIITAGNLDVKLEYSTDMENWAEVDANTEIFDDETLWEPGYTEVVYLRVSNEGSLALKYKLGVNVVEETLGKTKDGADIKLSDYIEYGVKEEAAEYTDRDAARADVAATATKLNTSYSKEFTLEKDADSDVFALVVYMPETVGNEANHNGTDIPEITLGLSVMATQLNAEEDSFGKDYDKDAGYNQGKTNVGPYKLNVLSGGNATYDEATKTYSVDVNTVSQGSFNAAQGNKYYAGYTVNVAGYDANATVSFDKADGTTTVWKLADEERGGFINNGVHQQWTSVGTNRAYRYDIDGDGVTDFTVVNDASVAKVEVANATELKKVLDQGNSAILTADINLGGEEWTPIGTKEAPYSGTFDGNGKTISGLKISSGNYAGFFGYVSNATIKNVTLSGVNVSGGERMGALVGQINGDAVVENCTVSGSVTGSDSNTGGMIGEIINGTVQLTNLKNEADVYNTKSSNSRAGGIVGQVTTNANVTLKNCVNNGKVTTDNGYAGGIVSAYQSGTLTIDNCVNNGALNGLYDGNMLGWYTSVSSITISTESNKFDMNAIGCVDIAISSNMSLYGKNYFVNRKSVLTGVTDTKQEFADIFAAGKIGTSPKALWDKLIAFYAHAAETNANFAGYPETYWEMFNKSSVGYSEPDWNSYFNSYNAQCGTGNELEKSEFSSASWREHIVYLAPEA